MKESEYMYVTTFQRQDTDLIDPRESHGDGPTLLGATLIHLPLLETSSGYSSGEVVGLN